MTALALNAFNPFEQHLARHQRVLRTLRLALGLCVTLIPIFGVALSRTSSTYVDPWWLRSLMTGIAALILAGTFVSRIVEKHALRFLTVYLCGLIVWIGDLAYVNTLQAEVAVGYLLTYVVVGVMLAFAYDHVPMVAALLASGAIYAGGIAYATVAPQSDPLVFVLSVAVAGIALLISSFARVSDQKELAAREMTLEVAERLGQIGSWSHDLVTGHRRWSRGMFRLVGESPHDGEPPKLFDYVPVEERAPVLRAERQMLAGETHEANHTHSIVRADGVRRDVNSIVRLDFSTEGEPIKMIGVVTDVTAQAENERVLVSARQEAEEAATLKSAILANMSHEIRTPLTAVIGYAQLLREELDEEFYDLITPIESSGERLLSTLNSVLDLAQMEAGRLKLNPQPLDLGAEVQSAATLLQEQADAKGISLHVSTPDAPLVAIASRNEISRALSHLISNGIKFTSEGRVSVRVFAERDAACVEVSDTGHGIDPVFLPRLFEPFWQESLGAARLYEGAGLGLTITHRLVTAMNGTIEVESTPNEGTTFVLRLPLAPTAAAETAWISRPSRRHSFLLRRRKAEPKTVSEPERDGA